MMQSSPPSPDPGQAAIYAELKIKDRERKRGQGVYPEDTSYPSQKRQLSRSWYVLIQLIVVVLVIVLAIILYHFLH